MLSEHRGEAEAIARGTAEARGSVLGEHPTSHLGKGEQAGYARCDLYREGDRVPVELDGQEVGQVAVPDLLP